MCSRQCHPQSRKPCPSVYYSIPSTLLGFGSICGHGPDLMGIQFHQPCAARYRVAACSTTLSQELENNNTARGQNCNHFRSPIREKRFLVSTMSLSTADAFDIVCRLDRNDTPYEIPRKKKQKIPAELLLDKQISKTQLGLYPVAPLEAWDRSVVIVLLTSRRTQNLFRVLLVLGNFFWFPSHRMSWALHYTKNFTLKNMITPAVLDAQVNLTLTQYKECPQL